MGIWTAVLLPDDGAPCLEERDVFRLAEAVREISGRAGSPQDVEWAFDGRDFLLLQCRPITALPTQHVYWSRLVSEMSPGLITPLMWSTKTRSKVRNVFGRIATELVGPNQLDFTKSIKRIHSRLYADMTAFGEFLELLGLPANFFEMMTRHERAQRQRSPLRSLRIARLPRLIRFPPAPCPSGRRTAGLYRRPPPDPRRLAPDSLGRIRARRTPGSLRPAPEASRQNPMVHVHRAHEHDLALPTAGAASGATGPGDEPGEFLRGFDGLTALGPNAELMSMVPLSRTLPPAARELMRLGMDSELRAELAASEEGRRLRARFEDFLDRFGFLSANGSDFTAIPWAEDPGPVWQAIDRFAQQAEAGRSLNEPRRAGTP